MNLAIALACQDELARHGVLVKISRTVDMDSELTPKINECNAFNPDLAVEIHNNAGGGDGCEVFHSIYGGTGKVLAENILSEAVKIGQNSRGAKTRQNSSGGDYYGWIRNTKAPAVIVECAFVDNKNDIQIIDTAAEQAVFGVAIAKGVLKTLCVAYKEPEAPVKTETTGKIYRVQVGAYAVKANAEAMQKKLKAAGYEAIIVEK